MCVHVYGVGWGGGVLLQGRKKRTVDASKDYDQHLCIVAVLTLLSLAAFSSSNHEYDWWGLRIGAIAAVYTAVWRRYSEMWRNYFLTGSKS